MTAAGFELTGKVAIVTGGGHGMGREIALEYAASGAAVVICSDVASENEAVARECREADGVALSVTADVRDEQDVDALVRTSLARLGSVDVLVTAAGIDIRESQTPQGAFVERTTLEQWNRVLGVNLTGTFLCIRAVLPHMLERRSGSIVTYTSSTVDRPIPGVGAYVASKAGIEGLTRVLALEVGDRGVRVNAIHPGGMTDTGLFPAWVDDKMRARMHRPAIVRGLAAYLAGDESRDLTGRILVASEWNRERNLALCSCPACS